MEVLMKKCLRIAVSVFLLLSLNVDLSLAQSAKAESESRLPVGEIAADSDQYIIGPEDVLLIHVWREETLTRAVTVRIDGKISHPLVDEIQAVGLTPLQLKKVVIEKIKKYVDEPVVSIIVMEANSFKVFVSGQVRSQGVYRLRKETTILELIPMVGGFTDWADQKKILIIRKEDGKEKRIIVNYKKIVKGDKSADNVILRAGDIVIVPD